MSKEIIKEAESKEELLARLEQAQKIYSFRKEELEDEELWGAMSKGVKKTYLTILKDLEDNISKLQKRLARIESGQPEEISMAEDAIVGGLADNLSINDLATKHNVSLEAMQLELEKGIEIESEHTSDNILAREIAMDHLDEDPNYYTKLSTIEVKPSEFDIADEIISNETPIITIPTEIKTNQEESTLQNLIAGLESLISKFKENNIDSEKEINLIKLDPEEDIASGSPIIAVPPIDSEDDQIILKGDLEEAEEALNFTNQEIENIINNTWYVWGGNEDEGNLIVEVSNNTSYNGPKYFDRYKIKISWNEPDFLTVEPNDEFDKASEELSKEIKDEIIYQLKLKK